AGTGGGIMITRSSSVALAVVMCAAGAFAQTTAVRAGGLGQASLTGPAGSPRVQLNLDAKTDRSPAPIALTADTLPLTLDEAVRRAVEHNPDLLVVRLATEVEAPHRGEARPPSSPTLSTPFVPSSVHAA